MKAIFKLLCLCAAILIVNTSFAQRNNTTSDPFESMLKQQGSNMPSATINADAPELFGSISEGNVTTPTMPLEGALNPDEYIIGPNDLFNLGLYGFINQQVPVYVLPEGSVVIPTVGEVKVAGLSLREAKSRVVSAVKKRYYSSDVSFTLTKPRTFIVKVAGLVQSSYEVSPVTRVSEIIKRIYYDTTNVARVTFNQRVPGDQLNTQMSLRNIKLERKNGSTVTVDIYKYFITGEARYNPYFLEGDMLKISNILLDQNFITVAGAVQLGGTYEYSAGDDLETVIGLGRGFDVNAEPDSIILYRPLGVNQGYDVINLSYERDKDFAINRFDRLFVKHKADYQKKVTVLVTGEVRRPGYYPINFKTTTVKEVVEMAGGFTEKAYLPLSTIFREYDKEYTEKDTAEILLNQRANDLIITDRDERNFWNDVKSRRNRVIVDFEKLYEENDLSQNVVLEDKDIVYINDDKKIIYVFGQVGAEGYIPFKEGESVEYYIERAGGYGLAADESNTRIIKFNSRGWYEPGQIELQSGDFIYVPKETERPFTENLTIIAQIVGALSAIITTYLLLTQD